MPDTPNPVNFTLQPVRTYKAGDRVRLVDSGWCPGTVTGVERSDDKDQYKVELDHGPLLEVEVTTLSWRIRPLNDEAPASQLPCSYLQKHNPS
jgi:hypothetical protein